MGEGLEFIFWCLAIGGTTVFVLKLVLMFVGFDGAEDADFDLDMDVDADDVSDSTTAFNLLSLQAVASLCMGAGWMGLTALKTFELSEARSIGLGLAFGVGLVFLIGKLMQLTRQLESSGTLDIGKAVGRSGTVYLRIPPDGTGQVQLVLQGRLVTVDARTGDAELPTGTKVKVQSVDAGGTLVVKPS